MEEEKLATLFQTLSVSSAADLPASTVNTVKAEPRALARLMPSLVEMVSIFFILSVFPFQTSS